MVPNGFTPEDAEAVVPEPKSPLAGAEVAVFVCPKRPPEPPLVVVLPKEDGALGFAGSDMLFGNGTETLGLGDLLAVDLRRGILGLGEDMLSCSQLDLPPEEEGRGGEENIVLITGPLKCCCTVVVASLIK